MADIGCLNTRLAVMRRKLFSRDELASMVSLPDVGLLIDRLLNTPYGTSLAGALAASKSLRSVDEALLDDLTKTVVKVRAEADEVTLEQLDLLLEAWDVDCLKAIFRGLHAGGSREEILEAAGPTVLLPRGQVEELADQADVHHAVDLLGAWGYHWGRALFPLKHEYRSTGDLLPLEWELMKRRFSDRTERPTVVQALVGHQAEVANIMLCMRFLGSKGRPDLLPQEPRSTRMIARLAAVEKLDDAITVLADSTYRKTVDRAALHMSSSGRVSLLERLLDRDLIFEARRWALREPLSVSVAYYYLLCKRNEVVNLRLITHCIDEGLAVGATMSELIMPVVN